MDLPTPFELHKIEGNRDPNAVEADDIHAEILKNFKLYHQGNKLTQMLAPILKPLTYKKLQGIQHRLKIDPKQKGAEAELIRRIDIALNHRAQNKATEPKAALSKRR